MKKLRDNNYFLIVYAFILIFMIVYLPDLLKKNSDGLDNKYYVDVKTYYGVNEYIPILVSDEQMSKKYLNDFIMLCLYDIDASYLKLNQDYRNEHFDSFKDYSDYIKSLNLSLSTTVYEFATYDVANYKFYDIYDKAGNRFIFKTDGVMQYEVYFDDYTGNEGD